MFNKGLINSLKKTINNLEDELDSANFRIGDKDALIEQYKKDNEILLNNSKELREKIADLENNIEFLINNLSKQKRELVRPDNQN